MMDGGGWTDQRRKLLVGLAGDVLEVGAGSGLNFGYCSRQVTRVLAVEPEPRLGEIAWRAADIAPFRIKVVDGIAERLPADDAAFDAVVACLVLCSVDDSHAALNEIRRVVRPGGQLRFFEHVTAGTRVLGQVQRFLDATVWPSLCGGCPLRRDTVAAIANAGFVISRLDPRRFPTPRRSLPFTPHFLCTASPA